jgi:PAP2 superfamily
MEKCVTSMRGCVFALMGSAAAAFSTSSPVFAQQSPAFGSVSPRDDAVIAWSADAGIAATKACIAPLDSPFHESRLYAMMHIAIHDALNAVDRRYRPYVFDHSATPGASPDAAVASAARDVLVPLLKQLPLELVSMSCIDAGVTSVEADYTAALAAIPDGPGKTQGIAAGQAAAAAILAMRAADGAVGPFLNPNCPQNTKPGEYQCIPGTPVTVFEGWERVTPFVLQDSAQFRPGPPYALTEPRYTADFNEIKRLGGNGSTTPTSRTADQTEIALFWYESSPLKWSRIARAVSKNKRLNMWENARLFGLLNMALADGYVAMVATKNHYNYWRPVTAIQTAATDGNPDTTEDKAWTPLRPTPPDQDYASGHGIEGGAAAEVLKQFFGTDQISFQDCGVTLPAGTTCSDPSPVRRSFKSFSQAADENAYSRVLIGFHFRKSVEEGTAYGRKIGERAVNLYLRPAR